MDYNTDNKADGRLHMKKMIERNEYLDWLKSWKEQQIIKVVSGVRRCGKSTLFELYKNWLVDNGVDKQQIIKENTKINEQIIKDLKRTKYRYKETLPALFNILRCFAYSNNIFAFFLINSSVSSHVSRLPFLSSST